MLVGLLGALLTFTLVPLANKAVALAEWLPEEDDDALPLLQFSLLQHSMSSDGGGQVPTGHSVDSPPSELRKTGAGQGGVAPMGTAARRQTHGQKLTSARRKSSAAASGTQASHVYDATLEKVLCEQLMGKHFTYIVNPGNAGDALIQHGTRLLFDKLGLTFHLGSYQRTYFNKNLVYAGAGNLIQTLGATYSWHYSDCAEFLMKNAPIVKGNNIILLPATIKGYSNLLRTLGSNVVIFTRERMSYDHVVSTQSKASVFLSHDMAFYIDKLDPALPALRARALRGLSCPTPLMLRTDIESDASQRIPTRNRDVSTEGCVNPVYASTLAFKQHVQNLSHHVMEAVSNCSEVWTDRLHVCIASCLVGTRVHCMDNCYGKNQAIFEHSINGQYPNASWEGDLSKNQAVFKFSING